MLARVRVYVARLDSLLPFLRCCVRFALWMSISNFSNYIVICRKGIAICKAILVSPSSSMKLLISVVTCTSNCSATHLSYCFPEDWQSVSSVHFHHSSPTSGGRSWMQQTLQRKPINIINHKFSYSRKISQGCSKAGTRVALNTAREHDCTNTCVDKAS